jgi:hypothetical protein
VKSRWESLQHFKRTFAHEHEECKDLLSAVKVYVKMVITRIILENYGTMSNALMPYAVCA